MTNGKDRSVICRCVEDPHQTLYITPEIGYDKAASISKEAFQNDKTIREVAREQTDLSDEELDEVLDARKMTGV